MPSAAQLAAAIGGDGPGLIFLGPRPVGRGRSRGGDAGDEDEALEARRPAEASLDEMARAFDVGRFESRIAGRLNDSGQMKDPVPARDGRIERGGIPEISDHELDRKPFEAGGPARPSDETGDVMAAAGERRRQPASDETARARDQGLHASISAL